MEPAQTHQPLKVIIIGSGLAGCLLANGLIRARVETRVYERLPQNSKREGYQVRLGASALVGLRACLDKDHLYSVISKFGRAGGSRAHAPALYNKHFENLINLASIPGYSKSAPINRVVLRDLLASPVEKAGCLFYERQFEKYQVLNAGTGDEKVRVCFSDGSTDECDILIGADGNHSKINQQLGLDNIEQLSGQILAMAKGDLPTERFHKISPKLLESPVLTFAEEKLIWFSAYLPDKKSPAKDRRVGFDDSLSSCMFAISVPTSQVPADIATRAVEEKWSLLAQAIQGWDKGYHEALDLVRDVDPHIFMPRVSKKPSRNWRRKAAETSPEGGNHRVWLIGDAAHAMLPLRGMGGNQAMHDTATALPLLFSLARKKESGQCSAESIKEACKKYEEEMIPRAFGWVAKSGGKTIVPIDSAKFAGRVLFFLAKLILPLVVCWAKFTEFVGLTRHVDDAKELED